MTAEPGNLCALNSFKYSGLANKKVLDIKPVLKKPKESIVMTTSNTKRGAFKKPKALLLSTGLKKASKGGLEALDKKVAGGCYRRDLLEIAKQKYVKVKQSFKKKKAAVKSRRAAK